MIRIYCCLSICMYYINSYYIDVIFIIIFKLGMCHTFEMGLEEDEYNPA